MLLDETSNAKCFTQSEDEYQRLKTPLSQAYSRQRLVSSEDTVWEELAAN